MILTDLDKVKEKQLDVVSFNDINEIRSKLLEKADQMDMIKIYDMKANKKDIGTVTKTIDEIHKHVQQLSHINLSTIKNLLLESKNNETIETQLKNRTILLQQSNALNNIICDFKIGDAHNNN